MILYMHRPNTYLYASGKCCGLNVMQQLSSWFGALQMHTRSPLYTIRTSPDIAEDKSVCIDTIIICKRVAVVRKDDDTPNSSMWSILLLGSRVRCRMCAHFDRLGSSPLTGYIHETRLDTVHGEATDCYFVASMHRLCLNNHAFVAITAASLRASCICRTSLCAATLLQLSS